MAVCFGDKYSYEQISEFEATHINYIRHTVLASAVDCLPIA